MTEIKSIEPHEYNQSLAEALKQIPEFEEPEWVFLVKSGSQKERPIAEPDFWYKRAASILKQIYVKGIVGTQRLRTRYGGRKNRGGKPEQFKKSGGKIIRTILQQAEAAGLIEKAQAKRSGRKLTAQGKELLESISPTNKGDKE